MFPGPRGREKNLVMARIVCVCVFTGVVCGHHAYGTSEETNTGLVDIDCHGGEKETDVHSIQRLRPKFSFAPQKGATAKAHFPQLSRPAHRKLAR